MGCPATTSVDERLLMGRFSGVLWLGSAVIGAAGQALAPATADKRLIVWVLDAAAALYGLACLLGWIPWDRASLRTHAVTILAMQPVIGLALWVTGGAGSYLTPALVLAMLYLAYFFPPRLAWPLAAAEVLTAASPLLYVAHEDRAAFAARVAGWALTAASLVSLIGFLKGRLVAAERHQRDMAHRDPLTGLENRRAFDAALRHAGRTGSPFALLFADLDDFKAINDTFGHLAGDRVLRELAAHGASGIRAGDCLARVGGDEFAVVAPGADRDGAARLAACLHAAAGRVRPAQGAPAVRLTIATAAYPHDGDTLEELQRCADKRLHAQKRGRQATPAPVG